MKGQEIISQKIKYRGDWLDVISSKIELANGKVVEWETPVPNGESVAIVALDKENNIYLVKEWRVAWDRELIYLPIGGVKLDATEKEIIQQARNELREEVGLDAKKIERLASVWASPRIKFKQHVCLARELFKSPKEKDEDESIEVVKMPLKKACELFLEKGEETISSTMIGLLLVKERLKL